jgi:predicted signal transduction protein with EAL and GGDEF domain
MGITTLRSTCIEPNARVLVVDDNPAIHDDIRKSLTGVNTGVEELDALEASLLGAGRQQETEPAFEISSAFQGAEALERVIAAREQGRPFALAFVDVRMPPGMDGVETTARLLEADPELSVVICSAYSDHSWEEMTARIRNTDRVLILKKPFDTIEVRQLAHALRARWQLARLATMRLEELGEQVRRHTDELEAAKRRLEEEARAREQVLAQLAESNEQIRALAFQDGLTGLPNRRVLHDNLEKLLARSSRRQTEFAVLFVDLDNFKRINDTVGHHGADEVLRQLATTLGELIRAEDVLALYVRQGVEPDATASFASILDSVVSRVGGDEFVILLPELRDRFAAGTVANRILERLDRPFSVGDTQVFVTASIGIATYPADGTTAEVLLRNADTAMYHAKQQGKAAFQYYSREMNAASMQRLKLESGLRHALDAQQFELHYQPQVEMETGRIMGAEALLRWRDPDGNYIPPGTFISIAEDSGLIVRLGEWVIRESCRQVLEWQRAGLAPPPISVNVSAVQFRRQNLAAVIGNALRESGIDARLLKIEITESSLMSVREAGTRVLHELRGMGVEVSLDDFGTGYSSLSYLRTFPVDLLKIDRSFVAAMLHDEKTAAVIEAIINVTRVLRMKVLAEGVERQEQFDYLRGLGCDFVQGNLVSAALSAREFGRLLAARRRPSGPRPAVRPGPVPMRTVANPRR